MCYNRPEVIFMTLDRPHARQAFAEYTSHYNAADPKVKLKIDQTYRVAALCERIANSLCVSRGTINAQRLVGAHDGRSPVRFSFGRSGRASRALCVCGR